MCWLVRSEGSEESMEDKARALIMTIPATGGWNGPLVRLESRSFTECCLYYLHRPGLLQTRQFCRNFYCLRLQLLEALSIISSQMIWKVKLELSIKN